MSMIVLSLVALGVVHFLPGLLDWCDQEITRANNETLRRIREQEVGK